MSEQQTVLLVVAAFAVFFVLLVVFALRRSSQTVEAFYRLGQELGLQDLRRTRFFGAGVRGMWNGHAVRMQMFGRYKSMPERVITQIATQSPGRILITRRTGGILSKPMTMFGPPIVTPQNLPDPERFWVRSDQPAFIERFFAGSGVAPQLETNLIVAFDLVDLSAKRLVIRRATDESKVRNKYGIPMIRFRRDARYVETIAREEWQLATMMVRELSLRP